MTSWGTGYRVAAQRLGAQQPRPKSWPTHGARYGSVSAQYRRGVSAFGALRGAATFPMVALGS